MVWNSKENDENNLDQEINTFNNQIEEEKENAFVYLIVKIIVQATLKEYYEIKGKAENDI